MPNVVLINGSYRKGGVTDQVLDELAAQFALHGLEARHHRLRDKNLKFCTNCRVCMLEPGEERARCVLDDDADALFDEIDAADWLVLGAPVNVFNVTALMRLFLERMGGYAHWPWGQPSPKFRKKPSGRRAILVSSTAMPAPMAALFTKGVSTLKDMAKYAGFRTARVYRVGMAAQTPRWAMPQALKDRIARQVAQDVRS